MNIKLIFRLVLFVTLINTDLDCVAQHHQGACTPARPLSSLVRDLKFAASGIQHPARPGSGLGFPQTYSRQQSLIPLYDTVYFWSWDTTLIGWQADADRRVVNFLYDANNNQISYTQQTKSGLQWTNYQKEDMTYDLSNNLLSQTQLTWDGVSWVNQIRGFWTYDSFHNILTTLTQSWNANTWTNGNSHTYTYNSNNNVITHQQQYWYLGVWENFLLESYSYNSLDSLQSLLVKEWYGTYWEFSSLDTFVYDVNNNRIYALNVLWNGFAWENYSRANWTYNANQQRSGVIIELWDVGSWTNFYKQTYTYDINNHVIGLLEEHWNAGWILSFLSTYIYDVNNNLTELDFQRQENGSWVNYYQSRTYYSVSNLLISQVGLYWDVSGTTIDSGDSSHISMHVFNTGLNDRSALEMEYSIFPNPCTESFSLRAMLNDITKLELYNVMGERLFEESIDKGSKPGSVNMSGYADGVYLLKVYSEKGAVSVRILHNDRW